MAPQPTVGLVGSRFIDEGLQSTNKKTVTEFAFPAGSRSADAIGKLPEGTASYTGPKNGDCYKDGVEDTNMLYLLFVFLISLAGTYSLQYVQ